MNIFKKRGMTDIEVVIAVSIFLFAVVFIIYSLNVSDIWSNTPNKYVDVVESKIKQDAEINYTTLYLLVSGSEDCFNVPIHSDLLENIDENSVFIGNSVNGEQTAFNVSEDRLKFNINNTERIEGVDSHTYIVYYFPFNVTSEKRLADEECSELAKGIDYNYSISYGNKIFVYNNLTSLGEYNALKARWNIQKDFAIKIMSGNEAVFYVGGTKPLEVDVRAGQFPIKIINETGYIKDAIINIEVW